MLYFVFCFIIRFWHQSLFNTVIWYFLTSFVLGKNPISLLFMLYFVFCFIIRFWHQSLFNTVIWYFLTSFVLGKKPHFIALYAIFWILFHHTFWHQSLFNTVIWYFFLTLHLTLRMDMMLKRGSTCMPVSQPLLFVIVHVSFCWRESVHFSPT